MLYTLFFYSDNKYILRLFLIKIESFFSLIGKTSSIKLPKNFKKITVLKSTHVNKKSKEQFELCGASFSIKIKVPIANKFLFKKLITLLIPHKPSGISFKIEQFPVC